MEIRGYFAIGIALGVGVGLSSDNLGLWLPVGVALGFAFEALIGMRERDRADTPDADDPKP